MLSVIGGIVYLAIGVGCMIKCSNEYSKLTKEPKGAFFAEMELIVVIGCILIWPIMIRVLLDPSITLKDWEQAEEEKDEEETEIRKE